MICLKTEDGHEILNHEKLNQLIQKHAKEIGVRLRWIRNLNRLEVQKFAELVCEESVFIQHFEDGLQIPPDGFLKRVCEKMGIRYEWLVNGMGDAFKEPPEERDAIGSLAVMMDEGKILVVPSTSAKDSMLEAENEMNEMIKDHDGDSEFERVWDSAFLMASAYQREGFERGICRGASLVFQLLTGRNDAEAGALMQSAIQRLYHAESAPQVEVAP